LTAGNQIATKKGKSTLRSAMTALWLNALALRSSYNTMDDQKNDIVEADVPSPRFGWLGLLLLVAAVVLATQLFPGAWARFVDALDFRKWTWQGRLYANVGLVAVLILIRYGSAVGKFFHRGVRSPRDGANLAEEVKKSQTVEMSKSE
jgi:hypothetical protein